MKRQLCTEGNNLNLPAGKISDQITCVAGARKKKGNRGVEHKSTKRMEGEAGSAALVLHALKNPLPTTFWRLLRRLIRKTSSSGVH